MRGDSGQKNCPLPIREETDEREPSWFPFTFDHPLTGDKRTLFALLQTLMGTVLLVLFVYDYLLFSLSQ